MNTFPYEENLTHEETFTFSFIHFGNKIVFMVVCNLSDIYVKHRCLVFDRI